MMIIIINFFSQIAIPMESNLSLFNSSCSEVNRLGLGLRVRFKWALKLQYLAEEKKEAK